MSKRWKAIVNHTHRFKVTLAGWSAMRGLFFRNKVSIGFFARVQSKFLKFISEKFAIGFDGALHKKGRVLVDNIVIISLNAKMRSILLLKHLSGFAVGACLALKRRVHFNISSCIGLDFVAEAIKKGKNYLNAGYEVGFSASNYKRGRLFFNNRKLTIFTVTLLKQFNIGQLKQKNIQTMKRQWRTVPHFKIVLTANLNKREVE